MKDLLPYYERELNTLRHLNREFAEQYPALAGQLGMVDGVASDPHTERLIQSTALLNARTVKLLDAGQHAFTAAMLQVNAPHCLQPFPSVAIAQFKPDPSKTAGGNVVAMVRRGTILSSNEVKGVVCQFSSAYDVVVAPLQLARAAFSRLIDAPSSTRLPSAVTSSIRIDIESTSNTLEELCDVPLRVFIDGEQAFCAALRDALFMQARHAYVQADGAGPWIALERVPIHAVGFSDTEALLPSGANSHPSHRLLTESFVFPEKFNFFDLDLAAIFQALPAGCQRVALHLALVDLPSQSDTARKLVALSNKHLLLGCTPVVNLFKRAAVPFELTHMTPEYTLMAAAAQPSHYDIHSVDAVRMMRSGDGDGKVAEFRPYYSLRHGEAGGSAGRYWTTRRDEVLAITSPGHETKIAFCDLNFNPMAHETAIVSAEVRCTNRGLAAELSCGRSDGDLKQENATDALLINLLRKPAAPCRYNAKAPWVLISQLSTNLPVLLKGGIDVFKEMLLLHDIRQSAAIQRQVRGVVAWSHQSSRAWVSAPWDGGFAHGFDIRITLDEEAFAGSSLHAFAQVLDHFLGQHAPLNCFTRLIIVGLSKGEEIWRCQPRSGDHVLV